MYCIRKVNDDYTWVGADCRRLALFEGVFGVPDGVSFNSYLLMDDKTVLFDTVDSAVRTTFRENVAHVLNGKAPDYLVVHHMEPDHAAEMADLARQYPDMGILCSAAAKNMIAQFFDAELAGRVTVVKEGDTLCTGRHTLRFIAAPMVHWPEVLMTYDETDKLLLSADAFGSFGALNGTLFADEVDFDRRCWTRHGGIIPTSWASTAHRSRRYCKRPLDWISVCCCRFTAMSGGRTWAISWANTTCGAVGSRRSAA